MADIDGEIIVVDNDSTDGSRAFFRGRFSGVKFIYNKKNVGFGAANNEALAVSQGKYILFLNPDTLIAEDCLGRCIHFLRSKDDRAALGVRMIDGNGRFLKESRRAFPDPLTSLYKLSGLAALFPQSKVFARYYLGHLSPRETHEADVLAGAFMMVPKEILHQVKGFDEDFFMYGEDVDLSYRIQQAGFSNYYFAETTIIHFKGESTKKGSLNYVKMFYQAMSIFVKKHYGTSRAGIFNFFVQAGIVFRGGLSLLARFLKWPGTWIAGLMSEYKVNRAERVVIVGTHAEYEQVLNKEKPLHPTVVYERISPDEKDETAAGKLKDLQMILLDSTIKGIIYCHGQLSFGEIIRSIEDTPKGVETGFFTKGSDRVIRGGK